MGQAEGNAGDVFCRLLLDAGQGMPFRFGLDGAEGFAVHEKGVVEFPEFYLEFSVMASPFPVLVVPFYHINRENSGHSQNSISLT